MLDEFSKARNFMEVGGGRATYGTVKHDKAERCCTPPNLKTKELRRFSCESCFDHLRIPWEF